jgi:hypothetical protein
LFEVESGGNFATMEEVRKLQRKKEILVMLLQKGVSQLVMFCKRVVHFTPLLKPPLNKESRPIFNSKIKTKKRK